jgi:hypothetical protein
VCVWVRERERERENHEPTDRLQDFTTVRSKEFRLFAHSFLLYFYCSAVLLLLRVLAYMFVDMDVYYVKTKREIV